MSDVQAPISMLVFGERLGEEEIARILRALRMRFESIEDINSVTVYAQKSPAGTIWNFIGQQARICKARIVVVQNLPLPKQAEKVEFRSGFQKKTLPKMFICNWMIPTSPILGVVDLEDIKS